VRTAAAASGNGYHVADPTNDTNPSQGLLIAWPVTVQVGFDPTGL
jgi:hypothetical protein